MPLLEKIEKLIKNLELKPSQDPSRFILRRANYFSSLCHNIKGEALFLKVQLKNKKEYKKKMMVEIAIQGLAKRTNFKFFTIPKLIKSYQKTFPNWFVREYQRGKISGNLYDIYGFCPQYLNQHLCFLLSSTIIEMQKIKNFYLFSLLPQRDFQWYQKDIKSHYIILKEMIGFSSLKSIFTTFKENSSLLNNTCHYFSHDDLYPNNILLSEQKIQIIDWDLSSLNNYLFDATLIWSNAWRKKNWQNHFIQAFKNKIKKDEQEFNQLFCLMKIFFGLMIGKHYFELAQNRLLKKKQKVMALQALRFFKTMIKENITKL